MNFMLSGPWISHLLIFYRFSSAEATPPGPVSHLGRLYIRMCVCVCVCVIEEEW